MRVSLHVSVDTDAPPMYNTVRFCPGRLLGQVFVRIPASPAPGVRAIKNPYRRDTGEAKTRSKR